MTIVNAMVILLNEDCMIHILGFLGKRRPVLNHRQHVLLDRPTYWAMGYRDDLLTRVDQCLADMQLCPGSPLHRLHVATQANPHPLHVWCETVRWALPREWTRDHGRIRRLLLTPRASIGPEHCMHVFPQDTEDSVINPDTRSHIVP